MRVTPNEGSSRVTHFNGHALRPLFHSATSGIYFVKLSPTDWRHVDTSDAGRPATVGPIYKSRSELLADSLRYCRESWGVG